MNDKLKCIIGEIMLKKAKERPVMTLTAADIPELMIAAYEAGLDAGYVDGYDCAQDMVEVYAEEEELGKHIEENL